jgi:hypothetical protein
MKIWIRRLFLSVSILLAFGFIVGASRLAWAQQAVEKRFDQLDQNKDGKVTPDELPAAEFFKQLDLDGNGEITKPEAAKALLKGALKAPGASKADGAATSEMPTPSEPDKLFAAPVRQGPKLLIPGEHGIGDYVADLELTDVTEKHYRLSELSTRKAIVFAMTSTSCPISRKYLPSLVELAKHYASRDVQFILVNPVATDKLADIQEAQKLFGNTAIYVFDKEESVAKAINAKTTTDVIVLDPSRTVAYHGAIDDQYGFGYSIDAPRHRYLAEALDALLDGRKILVTATGAPGCMLDIDPLKQSESSVTYHQQISRLLQRHCVECHREGGVGPFALDTYEDAVAHAPMIREVIDRGIMPPWFAATDSKEHSSPWVNDRSLSGTEKEELLGWIANGKLAGDPKDSPEPKTFPGGWLIGKPDAEFQFASPVQIKATGTMPYQNVVVETNLSEDKWVQAIEVRPGNLSVVHHVLVFVQAADEEDGPRDDGADERSGYWGIYVPGNSTLVYPDGYAKKIPKGAKLRFQMHYTPNGTATEDSTRIGLIFAKEPPKHEVRVAGIVNARISIPPGAANHQEVASIRLPMDVQVLGFLPHMHLRAKAARYDLVSASGTETMLDVPRYDFNWQLLYKYAEPVSLKAGDTLRFTAWYDNSANNPANPDPTKTVRWGPQTQDEMHLGYVEYIVPGEKPGEGSSLFPRGRGRTAGAAGGPGTGLALFKQLDVNEDGSITREEVRERMPNNPNAAGSVFDRLDSNGDDKLDKKEFEALQKMLQR